MALTSTVFDAVDDVTDTASVEVLPTDAFESGDAKVNQDALGVMARACDMTALAVDTGLTRQTLYRALGASGNPQFATILKVADALGLKLVSGNL